MKLLECEGKSLFKSAGIRIPKSTLIESRKDFPKLFAPCMVKAQVLSGKRGKAGLVKRAKTLKEAASLCKKFLLNRNVHAVLIEKILPIQKEYYLSLLVDGATKGIMGIFSQMGGVDIEEVAEKYPDEIIRFDPKKPALPIPEKSKVHSLIKDLLKVMQENDAELLEINPLIVTKREVIAADAKVVIDDNALFRHKEFAGLKERELTKSEKEAAAAGLHFVDLDGNIGIIGDGAGLVMATLDVVAHHGGKAANFLDVGGGANEAQMVKALQLVLNKRIKGLFINIFGGITRCDEVANAIVAAKKKIKLRAPLVVRMTGTNAKRGLAILRKEKITIAKSMDAGVKLICRS